MNTKTDHPFQLIKKVMAPLSAHQKSHDPPHILPAPAPVEIMNGPLIMLIMITLTHYFPNLSFVKKKKKKKKRKKLLLKIPKGVSTIPPWYMRVKCIINAELDMIGEV